MPCLERQGVVSSNKGGTGEILKVQEHVPVMNNVFPLVAEIWDSSNQTDSEVTSVESQEMCAGFPLPLDEVREALLSSGYQNNGVQVGLDLQTSFGILGRLVTRPSTSTLNMFGEK